LADVTLPSLGESVTEGIVTRWLKNVGDVVLRDEPLLEISTDKVDSEMPSPAAGVLLKIVVPEGDTAAVGAVVAVIGELDGDALAAAQAAPAAPAAAAAPAASAPTSTSTPEAGAIAGLVTSPVVRRILADGQVDPRSVTGTGPNGSITRRDAERAVAQGPSEEIRVPFTAGVKRMAEHMVQTVRTSPVGYVAAELDASVLASLPASTSDGVALRPEVVVAVAAIRALADFDTLNAEVTGDELIIRRSINVGVMKSLHPDGMLVPVVHAAGTLSVRAFARRLTDLDERVATRQLMTDDLIGGSISFLLAPSANTTYALPLLIQPQVAALAIGAVREVPVVRDGAVVAGRTVTVGLSFDHRVIEPVRAAAFLDRIGAVLSELDIAAEC